MSRISLLPIVGLLACGAPSPMSGEDAPAQDASPLDTMSPDAVPPDAVPPDAVPPDAGPPGPVAVTMNNSMAHVLWYGPDGALVAQAFATAGETVTADVPAGGMVVAIHGAQALLGRGEIVVGVEPGDDLQLGYGQGQTPAMGSMTASFAPWSSTATYRVDTPCGSSYAAPLSPPVTIELTPGCTSTGPATLIAEFPRPLAYIIDDTIDIADGNAVTIDGPWVPVTPTGTLTASGIPAGLERFNAERVLATHGVVRERYASNAISLPKPTVATVTIDDGWVPGDQMFLAAELHRVGWRQELCVPVTGDDLTLAVDEVLLPWFGGASTDANSITWQASAAPMAPDGVELVLTTRAEGYEVNWWVVVPPGQTHLAFPVIPDELLAFNPAYSWSASTRSIWTIEGLDTAQVEDYAQFRQRASMRSQFTACGLAIGQGRVGTSWCVGCSTPP